MAEEGTASGRQSKSSVQLTTRASSSPLRHRLLGRASTLADITLPTNRRRSSLISESLDDAFRSSTDDILLPKVKSTGIETHHEPSHWHSAPLALALLPAVGGLLFQNGGAIVTDVTLLFLAAVFLNWSVRLPWDWYCSAQSIRLRDPDMSDDFYPNNAIIEEDEKMGDEEAIESQSPSPEPQITGSNDSKPNTNHAANTQHAESELCTHELIALFACFILPLVGAWLLHAIRSQLSRPSEGLVSNYNLTIFLLGAEIRPLSHLIKMIQSRTLHLQRVVNSNPHEAARVDPSSQILDLINRLNELESHVADKSSGTNGHIAPTNAAQVTTEVRKMLQPDLDALNRAVRRYEKRATLLTLQTESRLQDLESRMADAISLAAAAERGNLASRRGSAAVLLDWACASIVVPTRAAWAMMILPARIAGKIMSWVEEWVGGRVRRELRTAGKVPVERSRMGGREKGKGMKKVA